MAGYSWAIFGVVSAALGAIVMLLQERLRVEPFALAIWCKVACIIVAFPLVVVYGLPHNPMFYAVLFLQALMFAVCDVMLFRHLPEVGAGVVSRLMPSTVVIGFFLWFVVDPSLVQTYIAKPVVSVLIACALASAAYFAMRLRKCAVSMQAVRLLWFVLLSNTAGPIIGKLVTRYAPVGQGAMAYTFAEAWMMIALWMTYLYFARPVSFRSLFAKTVWQRGLLIGVIAAVAVMVYVASFYYVDNPAYVSAVRLVDTVMIITAHRWLGKKDDSDRLSGFGIVASAAALIVLRAQL